MRYGSVCSGIEAATVAWHPLGWHPAFFAEIDPFPRAVLRHHWPSVPLHGDFTTIKGGEYGAIDLLVGGTPCQSFSVAGLRGGLADDRGNLALQFLRLADRTRPRWMVWENVPGVLSTNGGRDFGAIVGGMVELGYGCAWRILDAQYFGVPQRRRRLFLVGCLGDWRGAAAVLFERHSLSWDPPPRREARQSPAGTLGARFGACGLDLDDARDGRLIASTVPGRMGRARGTACLDEPALIAGTVSNKWHKGSGGPAGDECQNLVLPILESGKRTGTSSTARKAGDGFGSPGAPMFTLGADSRHAVAFKASHFTRDKDGAPSDLCPPLSREADRGDQDPLVLAFDTTQITHPENRSRPDDRSPQLSATGHPPAIAFSCKDSGADVGDLAPTLRAMGHGDTWANGGGQVAIAFEPRSRGDDGRGYEREPHVSEELSPTVNTLKPPAVAFQPRIGRNGRGYAEDVVPALNGADAGSTSDMRPCVAGAAVRRLTPRECERLQGFPDDYTLVPWRGAIAKDGPRYKALGNSMAVPVMRWIGERIDAVEALAKREAAE